MKTVNVDIALYEIPEDQYEMAMEEIETLARRIGAEIHIGVGEENDQVNDT